MSQLVKTRAELESLAFNDYLQHAGRYLWVNTVTGYPKDGGSSEEFYLDPPVLFRVAETSPYSIKHWNADWLDPYWDLELVGAHALLEGFDNFWTFGVRSYCLDGTVDPTIEFTVVPAPSKSWWRRLLSFRLLKR